MNQYNFDLDYSSSSFDIRNRFVGSIVYSLPFGRDNDSLLAPLAMLDATIFALQALRIWMLLSSRISR
jgi:hypothetical protein